MSVDWMAHQLAARPGGMRLEIPRYNPRPPGVMREDGTAKAIYEMLQRFPGRYFTFGEVMVRIGCTKRAADWGLRFLKAQQLIDCSTDEGRNARYLRYAYRGSKS
jgi:hypothetical protein